MLKYKNKIEDIKLPGEGALGETEVWKKKYFDFYLYCLFLLLKIHQANIEN